VFKIFYPRKGSLPHLKEGGRDESEVTQEKCIEENTSKIHIYIKLIHETKKR